MRGMILVNSDPTPAQEEYIKKLIRFSQTKDGKHVGLMLTKNQEQAYMLIATNLASKMSIDMRLINSSYSEEDSTKLSTMCSIVAQKYHQYNEHKGTQLIFSDIGTPGGNSYNIYQAIKDKLVRDHKIPSEEIAFVQDYNTKAKAKTFQKKLNSGEFRIALGSTKTLGTGKNVQKRITTLHQIDCPWTPKDREQRNGRGGRQGADVAKKYCNNVVESYYYATNRSLDAYKYTVLANKQRFIDQIKTTAVSRRIDEGALDQENGMSYNEYVALLSGNQDLLKKAQIEKKINSIEQDWKSFQSQQQDSLMRRESEVRGLERDRKALAKLKKDSEAMVKTDMENTPIVIKDKSYLDRKIAGQRLHGVVKNWVGAVSEPIARQGIFNLMIEKDLTHYENGRAMFQNKLKVVSDNGSVFNYAHGGLNENHALAGRYILDAVRRVPQVIENLEGRLIDRASRIKAFDGELKKVFSGQGELSALKAELQGIEDRIVALEKEESKKNHWKTQRDGDGSAASSQVAEAVMVYRKKAIRV